MADVTNAELKKYESELRNMLVCSFGYMEAEEEILLRCLDAIKNKDMRVLNKDLVVFCAGSEKLVKVDNTRVLLVLHRYGILKYIKEKINEQK